MKYEYRTVDMRNQDLAKRLTLDGWNIIALGFYKTTFVRRVK